MVVAKIYVSPRATPSSTGEADTRTRLLDAALDLIWEQSYGSVGVNEICDRAKVNKGSFYHFFNSKSDLAAAAYERHWLISVPKFDLVFAADVSPIARIERYCEAIYEYQRERQRRAGKVCGCPFASVGSEQGTQNERLRKTSRDILAVRVRYLETALRDAAAAGQIPPQDFNAAARSMSALVSGVLLQARIENDLAPLRVLVPGIFNLIVGYAHAPEASASDAGRRARTSKGNSRCG